MGIKYSVDTKFFDTWSPTMAYVLGFIYADGSIYVSERGSYIVITSTDKWIIYRIKKWLRSEHNVIRVKSDWRNGKLRFVLRIGNKELYKSLKKLGLYQNKSLTIGMPSIPQKFLKDFVRGYFDGDGCVYLYRSQGIKKKIILRKLSVIFTSGSKKFLEELLIKLKNTLELRLTKVYTSHRSFQLRFSTADSLVLFKFLYQNTQKDLYFIRKFNVFLKYLKLRPQRVDKKIKNVLRFSSKGHVAK